jgi:hypothetical protein
MIGRALSGVRTERCGIKTRSPGHGQSTGRSPAARRATSVQTSAPELTPPDFRVAVRYNRSGPSKAYRKMRNSGHGEHAADDHRLVPPPFSIHVVECRV